MRSIRLDRVAILHSTAEDHCACRRMYMGGALLLFGLAAVLQLLGAGWSTVWCWLGGGVNVCSAWAAHRAYRAAIVLLTRHDPKGNRWECFCGMCGYDCIPPETLYKVPFVPRGELDALVCGGCGRLLIFSVYGHIITAREPSEGEVREIMTQPSGLEIAAVQRTVRMKPLVKPYTWITPQDLADLSSVQLQVAGCG